MICTIARAVRTENSEDLAADIQLEDGDTGDEEGSEQEGV